MADDPLDRVFSTHHTIPPISIYPGPPSSAYTSASKPKLQVIHDIPHSRYASARTLVYTFGIDPFDPFGEGEFGGDPAYAKWYALIDEVEGLDALCFTMRVDNDGRYSGWQGPFDPNGEEMQALFSRELNLTAAFADHVALDIVAILQDAKHCEGGKHYVYQLEDGSSAPYVYDWRSISRAIRELSEPTGENIYPQAGINIQKKWFALYAPVLVPRPTKLGGIDGAMVVSINRENGVFTSLGIDMN